MYENKRRSPVHKQIREKNWSVVSRQIRNDPSLISDINGVGWSSLTLAVYHKAPTYIIAEMLEFADHHDNNNEECEFSYSFNDGINNNNNQKKTTEVLLSKSVTSGNRLCLHFAACYCDSLEVVQILAEAWPRALLHKSRDGYTPLDRAKHYDKDDKMLNWLEERTKEEKQTYALEQYNCLLKQCVLNACEEHYTQKIIRGLGRPTATFRLLEGDIQFVVDLYIWTKEREMIGLFQSIMSWVGVYKIPHLC